MKNKPSKTLALVTLLTLGASSQAFSAISPEEAYLRQTQVRCEGPDGAGKGYFYQQPSYQLDDPEGDLCLAARFSLTSKNVTKEFLHKKGSDLSLIDQLTDTYGAQNAGFYAKNGIVAKTENSEAGKTQPGIEGRKLALKPQQLEQALVEVINEERQNGIEPSLGTTHRWSPEFKRAYGEKYPETLVFSKLLIALGFGVTSRFMATGTEEKLLDWFLEQPENSVYPPELFRESYKLNNGDVYLSLLTIENVLSRYWSTNNRSDRMTTSKLARITSYYGAGYDKFGPWYHFFGISLYGYAAGRLKAFLIGEFENVGRYLLDHGHSQAQEDRINLHGGSIGADLHRIIKKKAYLQQALDPTLLEPSRYISFDEDFRDRIPVENTPEFKSEAKDDGIAITTQGIGVQGCQAVVMLNSGGGFNSDESLLFKDISLKPGRPTLLPVDMTGVQGWRIFLDSCSSS